MARISGDLFRGFASPAGDFDAEDRSRRANRRRLIVFLSVFAAITFVGLVWDFSRPPLYRATARLDFVPSTPGTAPIAAPVASGAADDTVAGRQYALRDEVQYLTSRTLLAKVWDDVKGLSATPPSLAAGDPPATLQAMLTATQVTGTNIVAIRAEGGEASFLPVFVDRLIADYLASLDERYKGGSTTALADVGDEATKLEADVAAKRREVDAFRAKNNIVSLERDENQVLSEVKGTGTALNTANEKLAAAEAKLAAVKEAQAAGRTVVRAKDNPTLAALEQQAVAIRADLRATARQFTAQYMDMDPRVREQRARLADLEEQLATIRRDSAQGAVQEAQEDVASARGAASALRQQLATNQNTVQTFTSHFNEYKALQEQLAHLEQLYQKAVDRRSVLNAGDAGRRPKVDVVERPAVPQSPTSPLYGRDAAIVVFGAIVAGLLTMGIVEFFNRPPRLASTVVVPQTWASVGFANPSSDRLPGVARREALSHDADAMHDPTALPAPLPRELTDPELVALLDAADPEFRAVMALFLAGLTPTEVVALRRGDVDRASGRVTVGGADHRVVALPPNAVRWLPAVSEPADAPLFVASDGRSLTEAALETALLYAAHDAGVDDADRITPATLRHTYVAFLLRQGLRFADVARIVGPLPTERLAAYRQLRATGEAPAADEVVRTMPVVSGFAG